MLTEHAPLRRAGLRHPRDIQRGQAYIHQNWRAHDFAGEPEYARCVAGYDAFVRHLEAFGVEPVFVPAEAGHGMAAIYARDSSARVPGGLVPARMATPHRAAEPGIDARHYAAAGETVLEPIAAPGLLEGGDIVWLSETLCAVGEGQRTNAEGIAQFRERVGGGVEVVPVPLHGLGGPALCFHLTTFFSLLAPDLAVTHAPLTPAWFRRWLETDLGIRVVDIPGDEFDLQGPNVLALAPRRLVMADTAPKTARLLEAEGCEVRTFPGHDVCVLGVGGPTCLVRPLARG